MKLRAFACLLLLLCITGCSGSGGGGGGAAILSGMVINLVYTPVSNADVLIGTNNAKTLSNGTYKFTNIPSGPQLIKIKPTFYSSSYKQITIGGGTSNAGITLVAPLDSKITPITPEGGTATNTNASIKMIFPPGALAGTENIVLTQIPVVAAPLNPPQNERFVSYIVYAKPDNLSYTMSPSPELIVPNLTHITTEQATFYRLDPNNISLGWQPFAVGSNEVPTNSSHPIKVRTPYLGWIAAIMPITPPPGWIIGKVRDNSSLHLPIVNAYVWTDTSFDITDSTGNFLLELVPTGEVTVYASALGYQPGSKGPIMVLTDQQSDAGNIDLNSLEQGNISGIVYKHDPYWSPLGNARVRESKGGSETYSDSVTGMYNLYNVLTGITSVTAYASGYISSTESVDVTIGGTAPMNFHLRDSGTVSTSEFGFETGTLEGFHTYPADGLWQVHDANSPVENYFSKSHGTINKKVTLPDSPATTPSIRPGGSGHWYAWCGQDYAPTVEGSYIGAESLYWEATLEYSGGWTDSAYAATHMISTLETPELTLSGYIYGKLSFWTWWEIESRDPSGGYDNMSIWISTTSPYTTWHYIDELNPRADPSELETISKESYTSGGFKQAGIWVNHNFDITPYIGGKAKIRFVFDTYDHQDNGYRGWVLDDISVTNSMYGGFSMKPKPTPIIRRPRHK